MFTQMGISRFFVLFLPLLPIGMQRLHWHSHCSQCDIFAYARLRMHPGYVQVHAPAPTWLSHWEQHPSVQSLRPDCNGTAYMKHLCIPMRVNMAHNGHTVMQVACKRGLSRPECHKYRTKFALDQHHALLWCRSRTWGGKNNVPVWGGRRKPPWGIMRHRASAQPCPFVTLGTIAKICHTVVTKKATMQVR